MWSPHHNAVRVTLCLSRVRFVQNFGLQVCGNYLENTADIVDSSSCDLACSGDSSELCGGADFYNLYTNVY